jgi:hypothetical protein
MLLMEGTTASAIQGAWSTAGSRNQPAAWRLTHNKMLLLVLGHCWVRLKNAILQGCRLTACTLPTQDRTPSTTRGLQPSCLDTYSLRRVSWGSRIVTVLATVTVVTYGPEFVRP